VKRAAFDNEASPEYLRYRDGLDVEDVMNRIALILLTLFVTAGAAFGGISLVAGADLGMDAALLEGTPFASYVVPGYILLIAVGGANLIAGILLLIEHEQAPSFAFLAGAVLTVWIAVQVAMIGMMSFLQPAMFAFGLMTMGFAYRYWLETNANLNAIP
jgi:hypothetical protein